MSEADGKAVQWLREQAEAELAYRRGEASARRYYAFIEQAGGIQTALDLDAAETAVARCESELAVLDLCEAQAARRQENAMEEDRAWVLAPVVRLLASGYKHRAGWAAHWGNDE